MVKRVIGRLQTKMEDGAPEPEILSRLPAAAPPARLSGAVLISMDTVVPANRRVSLLERWNTRGDLINTMRSFTRTSLCLNTWLPPGNGGRVCIIWREKNPGYKIAWLLEPSTQADTILKVNIGP